MAEDLFESALEDRFDEFAPLAARVRPRTLEEFVGQEHVVGEGGPLRALITGGRPFSMVLWGPPGSGKTSLARIISSDIKARFIEVPAVSSGVADVRKAIAEAKEQLAQHGRRTILFIDEIHRFNRAQQDALLSAVENGWVVLIGATTENPFFEVVSPLVSRSLLFRLEPLSSEEVASIVKRAASEPVRGLGSSGLEFGEEALDRIVERSGGDARFALNALEMCASLAIASGKKEVTHGLVEEALRRRIIRYDKGGDIHYDVISAFIKSMRGSDPNAAVWWLVQMIEGGEDPRLIARRMVIFASEDIGNADPMALPVAVSAFQALEFVGLPEARLNLVQAAIYLASAPKSNAGAKALWRATEDLEKLGPAEVPVHLREPGYPSAQKRTGHGIGYKYPHDYPGAWVAQSYLPEDREGRKYYEPTDRGHEREITSRLTGRSNEESES